MSAKNRLLLGTRKGLISYTKSNGAWKHEHNSFLGIPVSLAFIDERTNTWWACQDHGHWGCKLSKSDDEGKTWQEVESPKYPEDAILKEHEPASTKYLWAFSRGGRDQPGRLYIGTEPGGLFMSDDNGEHFELVKSLWDHPSRMDNWFGGGRQNPGIHSIIVDPRDNDHIYVGVSVAGIFETKDGGKTWNPKNKGLTAEFLPDPKAEVGHDPHLVVMCENHPEYLWQQNHCGIFKTTDGAENWTEVSEKNGPANFGFAISVDNNNPDIAWVVPGIKDEVRVAYDLALCVCRTEDGGKSWQAFRKGLPQDNTFDITYRHALDVDEETLVFGTTTGNVYLSEDSGESWQVLSNNLPMIYSANFY